MVSPLLRAASPSRSSAAAASGRPSDRSPARVAAGVRGASAGRAMCAQPKGFAGPSHPAREASLRPGARGRCPAPRACGTMRRSLPGRQVGGTVSPAVRPPRNGRPAGRSTHGPGVAGYSPPPVPSSASISSKRRRQILSVLLRRVRAALGRECRHVPPPGARRRVLAELECLRPGRGRPGVGAGLGVRSRRRVPRARGGRTLGVEPAARPRRGTAFPQDRAGIAARVRDLCAPRTRRRGPLGLVGRLGARSVARAPGIDGRRGLVGGRDRAAARERARGERAGLPLGRSPHARRARETGAGCTGRVRHVAGHARRTGAARRQGAREGGEGLAEAPRQGDRGRARRL